MLLRTEWFTPRAKRHQWLPAAELQRLQAKRLRALIKHAYENVPFHRERLRSLGLGPDDIRGPQDLHRIPPMTRTDVETSFPHGIVARGFDPAKCFRAHTSGSTGRSLTVVSDGRCFDHYRAATFRFRSALGIKAWDKWAVIVFSGGPEERPAGGVLRTLARDTWSSIRGKYGRTFLITYGGGDVRAGLLGFQPEVLLSRPLYLRYVAEALAERGEEL